MVILHGELIQLEGKQDYILNLGVSLEIAGHQMMKIISWFVGYGKFKMANLGL